MKNGGQKSFPDIKRHLSTLTMTVRVGKNHFPYQPSYTTWEKLHPKTNKQIEKFPSHICPRFYTSFYVPTQPEIGQLKKFIDFDIIQL